MTSRLSVLKTILWALVGILVVVSIARFKNGLGAVTNLSDAAPWGLWVGFDVMAGVALAAGGFVVAGTVTIFGLEKYRPYVRPAVLTAFLGYAAVAVGLLYDLGLPWHIWHPMIYPQHHSVLFEVAMCVMFYLAVLFLEFSPVILEHPLLNRPLPQAALRTLKKLTVPLVILGTVLSTLHQSSLGSLFLITPYRLHALWYSPIIYLLFFVSAVGLGLMMVTLESLLSAYFFHHRVDTKTLSHLGGAAGVVLAIYAALRLGDLAFREVLSSSLDGSWQSKLFITELLISSVLPALLLLHGKIRNTVPGLAICSSFTVAGMILYRLDVCFITFTRPIGQGYLPTWMELAVSLGIVAVGVLIFIFFVENFKVYSESEPREDLDSLGGHPLYHPTSVYGLMPRSSSGPSRYSLAVVTAVSLTVAILPQATSSDTLPASVPALAAREVEGYSYPREEVPLRTFSLLEPSLSTSDDDPRIPLILIDGNRDGDAVLFDHAGHIKRMGDSTSCGTCHHLSMPYDRNTSCYECHRDMYQSTSTFDHASHIHKLGGNSGCLRCHTNESEVKNYATAIACDECHRDLAAKGPMIQEPEGRWRRAASYMDAMHGLCVECHREKVIAEPGRWPRELGRCDVCHDSDRSEDLRLMAPHRSRFIQASSRTEESHARSRD